MEITVFDHIGDEVVLLPGLDADALPAAAEARAVAVGALPVVGPAAVVEPGEVVLAVAPVLVHLQCSRY